MEKISRIDRVRNEKELWSQGREELIDGTIQEKVKETRTQGIRRKQLLHELKASSRYSNLKKRKR
jgi:hypothetical protein